MTTPTALIVGAGGFVGRHIEAALTACGWRVWRGLSPRAYARLQDKTTAVAVDYTRDSEADWRERLQQTQASFVINAVGVLRDSRARPIEATHHTGPVALFNACVQSDNPVQRIIQISALGIEGSPTRYASTKRAADEHLLGLADKSRLSAIVLRPSVVFGKGGASSSLFMNLARLPVLCLPGPVLQARVQPVAVTDLAQAVLTLVQELPKGRPGDEPGGGRIIECTGPEAITLAGLIASLRQQCGHGRARMLRLPDALSLLSARVGDCIPVSPWCSESLALLGKDNVGDAAALRRLLGHDAVHYSQLVEKTWRGR